MPYECNRSFYNRDTCQVAQDLLGRYLVRMQDGRPLVIRITETEAYIGRIDKAATPTTTAEPPGTEPSSPRQGRHISTSSMVCTTA